MTLKYDNASHNYNISVFTVYKGSPNIICVKAYLVYRSVLGIPFSCYAVEQSCQSCPSLKLVLAPLATSILMA